MQEKDIREKLNQELDTMAPDILNKILKTPIEPVKSEKELFGKDKPLFKESNKRKMWMPVMTAVAACIVILIMIFNPFSLSPSNNEQSEMAFNIIIDVNPSISIKVNEDGIVEKIEAGNKDAEKIVKKVNKKINDDTSYTKAVKIVVKQLKKNGYLSKDENAMLVSVVSDNKEKSKEKLGKIKKHTEKVEKKKNINCTSVYQVCEETEEVKEVAEKNNVSIGKATLCIKLAKKENVSVKKMCEKSIYALVKDVEKNAEVVFAGDDEIIIEGSLISDEETTTEEETTSEETTSETETIEETTTMEGETTTESEGESGAETMTDIIETTVPVASETVAN